MSKLWGGLPPDFSQNRRAPNPLLPLVRELRDELQYAGKQLANADIPWAWADDLFTRASKVLVDAASEPQEGKEG